MQSPDDDISSGPAEDGLAAEPVDLTDDAPPAGAAADRRSLRYRAAALSAAVVFLVAVVAVAVMADRNEPPTPEEALAEVRGFVTKARTATFTGTDESKSLPKATDVGSSWSSKSKVEGRIRLPDAAYVLTDEGDYVTETLVEGDQEYTRSADTRAELSAEKWTTFEFAPYADMGENSIFGPRALDGLSPAAEDAAEFLQTMSLGAPLELDQLFSKLQRPARAPDAENKLTATVKLEDLVPEELRKAMAEAQADAGPDAGPDEAFEAAFPTSATLTVTIEHGPGGRLDVLVLDGITDFGDEQMSDRTEFRFADWGRPVDLAVPSADQVDKTPHLDEQGLAKMQQQFPVLAPTSLPAGWKLQSLEIYEYDEADGSCDSVELEYGPDLGFTVDDYDESVPPTLSIASVRPGCKFAEENEPDFSRGRVVKIGSATARFVDDAENNMYSTLDEGISAVIDVQGAHIVGATDAEESVLVEALRSLAPLDLAKQPIGQGSMFALDD